MDAPKPQKQHDWLRRLVGEWRYQVEIPAHDGRPASTLKGTEIVRPLGDVWILAEGRAETPGGPGTTLMTLGYQADGRWQQFMETHYHRAP